MKTKEQILAKAKEGSDCLDGRDFGRLIEYFPVEQWSIFGFSLKEGAKPHVVKEWTKENILAQLEADVAFGFEKALNRRGISSSLMNSVVKMWLWVLDDPLCDDEEYAQYGLPLFKKIAVKYGFPNEIGEDYGNEYKYSSDYGYD